MSLSSDFKDAFTAAYSASEGEGTKHEDISADLASALTEAISTCIEGAVVTTSYAGVTVSTPGTLATGVGVGSFDASGGKGDFESALYDLLMDIDGGSTFHIDFAKILTEWYESCKPTDSISGMTLPPPPATVTVPFAASASGVVSAALNTAVLASSILIPQSYSPASPVVGNIHVATVWSTAVIVFLMAGMVQMVVDAPDTALLATPSVLTAFV